MSPGFLTFQLVENVSPTKERAVGFLTGDQQLDAKVEFEALKLKHRDSVKQRMDRWCGGHNGPKEHFHGWTEQEFRDCFVFRLNENRFYGFKCHPLRLTQPAFHLCVLCIHAKKYEWLSEKEELRRVNQWRDSLGARTAIGYVYVDREGKKNACKPH